MLVLPRIARPAARSRATTVASYGGTQPSRICDPHGGRHALGGEHVLERERHAGAAARPAAPAARASSTAAAAASAPSASTCRKACTAAVDGRDPVQVGLGHLDAGRLARRRAPSASSAADRGVRSAHCSSPRIRGTAKRCSSTAGAPDSACSAVRPGRRRPRGTRSSAAAGARSAGCRRRRPRRPRRRDRGSRRAGRRGGRARRRQVDPRQPARWRTSSRVIVGGDGFRHGSAPQ